MKTEPGFHLFIASINLTHVVQQAMKASKTAVMLKEVVAELPRVLHGVDHPLAEDIVQVTCGKTIKVSLYVPIGTKTEDIDSFATALRSAATAHTSAVATKVNRRIASSMPNTPPRT